MAFKAPAAVGNPAPTGEGVPTRSRFAQQVAGITDAVKARPLVRRGREQRPRWVKILSYGHTGTGKSLALVGFLLAGLKIVNISTDLGGSGMEAVYNELRRINRDDLIDNIIDIEFPDYDSVIAFCDSPEKTIPDFYEFDPDMLSWDGFTAFQQIQLSEKVLSLSPATKNSSDGRMEGMWKEQQDWGMIRDGTLRALSKFLGLQNWKTGKPLHKYMTCLEQKPAADKLTSEIQRAPFMQGAAGSLMAPAFDIIFETRVTASDDKAATRVYEYCCVGHEKLLAKARGYDLAPIEPADMYRLWTEKIAPKLKDPNNVSGTRDTDADVSPEGTVQPVG